jgi:hypothetical protein
MNLDSGGLRVLPASGRERGERAARASIVASTIASSCTIDTKPASYADGAKYTPASSILWKNALKRGTSLFVTSAKLVGTDSVK